MKHHPAGPLRCARVDACLDEALATGELALPPHLAAHTARCSRCSRAVAETQLLFSRLRGMAAAIDTGPARAVANQVTAAAQRRGPHPEEGKPGGRRRIEWRWLLGQVAVVAALLMLLSVPAFWGAWRLAAAVTRETTDGGWAQVVESVTNRLQAGLQRLTGDVNP